MVGNRWCVQAEQTEQLKSQSQNKTGGGQVRRAGWCWLHLAPSSLRGPFPGCAFDVKSCCALLRCEDGHCYPRLHFSLLQVPDGAISWAFLTTENFTLSFAEREGQA